MKSIDPRLLILFITATLQLMGVGLAIPTIPSLIRKFSIDTSSLSIYFSLFFSLYGLTQFLAAPLLGALSDRFGRKPILLLSLLGAACDYLFMAYAPNIVALLIFRMISGLCAANVTICMACASDISTKENKGTYYSTISAAFGLGLIIGPVIGGTLGSRNLYYPFIAASILYLVNFLFVLFFLPESLDKSQRRPFSIRNLNPLVSLNKVFNKRKFAPLYAIYFFIHYCAATNPAIWSLFTEYKFKWTPKEIGLSLTIVGLLTFFSQAFLSRIVMPRFGYKNVLKYSVLGNIFAYFCFAISQTHTQIYFSIVFLSLFFLALPAAQALISESRSNSEQGELQGSLVSLNSLSTFLNPLISTQIFSYFTIHFGFYGAPYVVASFISLMIFFGILKIERNL